MKNSERTLLRLHGVRHAFTDATGQTRPVLENFSLQLQARERVALLGLSGSGKSTVLRIAMGLIQPTSGEVEVFGVRQSEIGNLSEPKFDRRRIGYVIQDGGLFPHLSARQNLTLIAQEDSWSLAETQSRIEELCQLTRLPLSLLDKYPRELSGGQRQRVGLMRALLRKPELLLLDEPMGALDPITRDDLQRELGEMFEKLAIALLLVTHDLREARRLTDRIVLLNEGRIEQEGQWSDLVDRPASEFVRRFVGAQREVHA
ncbi:MAG TPA: ATP-binding cassette domain-containing protein [Pseudobdellovibrionaceae bacterium]|nr:ATP-binding cassette domain-containing protein [Pseudobdellovibrionaceae bacterium]